MEEPLDLPAALAREAEPGRAVLADCLTLWLSNLMLAGRDPERETARLVAVLDNLGKGASGAAVQSLNLMAGLDETAGLRLP